MKIKLTVNKRVMKIKNEWKWFQIKTWAAHTLDGAYELHQV